MEKEEEAAEAVEELDSSLEIRQRKKGKMGREDGEKLVNGEEYSVYLDEDEGEVNNVTAGLESRVEDIFVAEENIQNVKQNGNSVIGDKGTNEHENIPVAEENHNLKNLVTENGSNSHLSSANRSQDEATKPENEIEECEEYKPENGNELLIPEFVERVVEEQETHDFYCPNCNSCITERVILKRRKRKRVPSESQPDLPPEKVPHVQEPIRAPTELEDDERETGFRCLECLSFFIPTEGGFISWIFGRRSGSKDLQSSKIPSRNETSSLSSSDSSKKKGTGAEVPLLGEDSGGTSLGQESFPPIPISENASFGENGSSIGINNAGPLAGQSYFNEGVNGKAQESTQSYPPAVSEIKQKYPALTVSKDPLAGASGSNGGLVGDQHQGITESYMGTIESEANGTAMPTAVYKPPSFEDISRSNQNVTKPPAAPFVSLGNNIKPGTGSMAKPTPPIDQNIHASVSTPVETRIDVGSRGVEPGRDSRWDVLKSIVYGGLIEAITSLSIVSSAAGSGTSTLYICALGLANLVGGLFVISHDLSDLKNRNDNEASDQSNNQSGRYWELLGKREHFRLHAVVAVLSYIIFGSLPPIIYGFAFRESDNKDYKLIAVAAASLLCIALLAIAKAHVRPQRDYFKSILYYLVIAVPASGLSYVAGVMLDRLFEELCLFDHGAVSPSPPSSSIGFSTYNSGASGWASI